MCSPTVFEIEEKLHILVMFFRTFSVAKLVTEKNLKFAPRELLELESTETKTRKKIKIRSHISHSEASNHATTIFYSAKLVKEYQSVLLTD